MLGASKVSEDTSQSSFCLGKFSQAIWPSILLQNGMIKNSARRVQIADGFVRGRTCLTRHLAPFFGKRFRLPNVLAYLMLTLI